MQFALPTTHCAYWWRITIQSFVHALSQSPFHYHSIGPLSPFPSERQIFPSFFSLSSAVLYEFLVVRKIAHATPKNMNSDSSKVREREQKHTHTQRSKKTPEPGSKGPKKSAGNRGVKRKQTYSRCLRRGTHQQNQQRPHNKVSTQTHTQPYNMYNISRVQRKGGIRRSNNNNNKKPPLLKSPCLRRGGKAKNRLNTNALWLAPPSERGKLCEWREKESTRARENFPLQSQTAECVGEWLERHEDVGKIVFRHSQKKRVCLISLSSSLPLSLVRCTCNNVAVWCWWWLKGGKGSHINHSPPSFAHCSHTDSLPLSSGVVLLLLLITQPPTSCLLVLIVGVVSGSSHACFPATRTRASSSSLGRGARLNAGVRSWWVLIVIGLVQSICKPLMKTKISLKNMFNCILFKQLLLLFYKNI